MASMSQHVPGDVMRGGEARCVWRSCCRKMAHGCEDTALRTTGSVSSTCRAVSGQETEFLGVHRTGGCPQYGSASQQLSSSRSHVGEMYQLAHLGSQDNNPLPGPETQFCLQVFPKQLWDPRYATCPPGSPSPIYTVEIIAGHRFPVTPA